MNLSGIVQLTLFYKPMISLALLTLFIAFYVFYNTSEKTIKQTTFGFETWINEYQNKGRILALILLLISLVLSYISFGFGAGIILFFAYLMTFGSLIVILNPLKILKLKSIVILFMFSLCIEFFVFQ